MRWIFLILFFCSCRIEKTIQVQRIYLTVIKIETAYREYGTAFWITWKDDEGVEYKMICDCWYKVGDRMAFLITK